MIDKNNTIKKNNINNIIGSFFKRNSTEPAQNGKSLKRESQKRETLNRKSRKRKPLKILLYALGGFLVLVGLLLVSLFFVLQSGSLTQRGVQFVSPYLKVFGVKAFKLDSLKIDVMRSVSLSNLELQWQDEKLGTLSLELGQFLLIYCLADIWQNQLTIEQFLISDINLKSNLILPETGPAPSESEAINWQEIETLLNQPAIDINLKELLIKNIQLDVSVQQKDLSLHFNGKIEKISQLLSWHAAEIKGTTELMLAESVNNSISIVQKSDDIVNDIQLQPSMAATIDWQLSNETNQWELNQLLLDADLGFDNLKIRQDEVPIVSIESFDVSFNSKNRSVVHIGQTGLQHILPVMTENKLKLNFSELATENFRMNDQQITINADQEMSLQLKGKVNPLVDEIPEVNLQLSQKLTIPAIEYSDKLQQVSISKFNYLLDVDSAIIANNAPNASQNVLLKYDVKFSNTIQAVDVKQTKDNTIIRLSPEVKLKLQGELFSFKNPIDTLKTRFQPELILNDIYFSTGKAKNKSIVTIKSQKLKIDGELENTLLTVQANIGIKNLDVPQLKKQIDLSQSLKLKTDLAMQSVNIDLNTRLQNDDLMSVNLSVSNEQKNFRLNHNLNISLIDQLYSILPDLKELDAVIGRPEIKLQGNLVLGHNKSSIDQVDFEKLEKLNINLEGGLEFTQVSLPTSKEGVVLSQPVKLEYSVDKLRNKKYQTFLNVKSPGVFVPPLLESVSVIFENRSTFTLPIKKIKSSGLLAIDNQNAFEYKIDMSDGVRQLEFDNQFKLIVKPEWKKYIADISQLGPYGGWQADVLLDGMLKHKKTTMLDVDLKKIDDINLDVDLGIRLTQSKQSQASDELLIKLNDSISIDQQLVWSSKNVHWQSQFEIDNLIMSDVASIKHYAGNLQVINDNGLKPSNIDFDINIDVGEITLYASATGISEMSIGDLITPMLLNGQIGFKNELISVKWFDFDLSKQLVSLNLSGSTSTKMLNTQFSGLFEFRPRANMLSKPDMSGKGVFRFPWHFAYLNNRNLALRGDIGFENFSISYDDFSVMGLDGKINFDESFILEKDRLRFTYLEKNNAFQRVDFGRIQPFLDVPAFKLDRVNVGEISAGPLQANISLQQNLLRFQQFDIGLFGGFVAGQFYLDAYPAALKLGLLSRMTAVDLRKMFPGNKNIAKTAYSPINMRTAIELDFNQKLIEGRIDITKISRDQLLQLLELVDPEHIDTRISSLRSALLLAFPKTLSIVMRRGLMDVSVSLSSLPAPIKIIGLPLTAIMQQFSADISQLLLSLPIDETPSQ